MKKRNMAVKAMAGMMGAALLVSAPVYAENGTSQKNMQVVYEEGDNYLLSIPAEISLQAQSGAEEQLGVERVNIQPGKKLSIKITSDHVLLQRKWDNSYPLKTVSSDIEVDGKLVTGASVEKPLTIAEYKGTITKLTEDHKITFKALEDADGNGVLDAGTYNGTITFVAEIEDAPTIM